jgi:hypothetical protein
MKSYLSFDLYFQLAYRQGFQLRQLLGNAMISEKVEKPYSCQWLNRY